MKSIIKYKKIVRALMTLAGFMFILALNAQDENTEIQTKPKHSYAKNTFESVWLMDNQTVMVPVKGTFEFDIMHRFGRVNSEGEFDLYGLFAPSNIRMGFAFAPIDNLYIGSGLTKDRLIWDGSVKYAIFKQSKECCSMPVSITYYGFMSYDFKQDDEHAIYKYQTDRLRYFHQLIIARKVTSKLSIQVAPSLSYQNSVDGYYYNKEIKTDSFVRAIGSSMKHAHFAISVSGRYKLTENMSLLANYDQPLTKHTTNNPNPNLSLGLEIGTSGHAFQICVGNYRFLNPQRDNLFNKNSPLTYTNSSGQQIKGGNFSIGFNITRLWNF
ncbi:MAG: hypothetical protein K1X68_10335 [Saprospiraceae bacterium]|nr:hypothetical protein [Saprospiraceae bacterium]HMW39340.1 DUF5777 family beta-barrel protein [Saprospiraceae bacterium]HMX89674.1 DUF5777 family beta-barrel protein [Saprospiraceae bacterium]HMZ41397.1 DUF5777 family beta-barrel protein [Saprospiraceae bacterium]HNA63785.1 DUF5777 family beta-barrel protein [Saprospiraceae bacterium]